MDGGCADRGDGPRAPEDCPWHCEACFRHSVRRDCNYPGARGWPGLEGPRHQVARARRPKSFRRQPGRTIPPHIVRGPNCGFCSGAAIVGPFPVRLAQRFCLFFYYAPARIAWSLLLAAIRTSSAIKWFTAGGSCVEKQFALTYSVKSRHASLLTESDTRSLSPIFFPPVLLLRLVRHLCCYGNLQMQATLLFSAKSRLWRKLQQAANGGAPRGAHVCFG